MVRLMCQGHIMGLVHIVILQKAPRLLALVVKKKV